MRHKLIHQIFDYFASQRYACNSAPAFNKDQFCTSNSQLVEQPENK